MSKGTEGEGGLSLGPEGESAEAFVLEALLGDAIEQISNVEWSVDGTLIATGHPGGLVRLWDGPSGVPLRPFNYVDRFALCPRAPLIAKLREGRLLISPLAGGDPMVRPITIGSDIYGLAWTSDGTRVVSAAHSGEISEFNVLKQRRSTLARHLPRCRELRLGPNDELIVLGHDGVVRGRGIYGQAPFETIASDVSALCMSPAGTLWLGFRNGRVRAHRNGSFWPPDADFAWTGGSVRALSASAGEEFLSTKSEDGRLIVWSIPSAAPVAVIDEAPVFNDEDELFWSTAMAFSPVSSHLVTSEATARLWRYDREQLIALSRSQAKGNLPDGPERAAPDGVHLFGSAGLGSGNGSIKPAVTRNEFYGGASRVPAYDEFQQKNSSGYVVQLRGGMQRKERTHEATVAELARELEDQGARIASPHPIDLVMLQPEPIIFETKRVGTRHPGHAIREAIGQLWEYRYFLGPRDAKLCICLDQHPRDEALIRFVEDELAMLLLWVADGRLAAGPKTRDQFETLGIDCKPCDEN